jgi:hypothetical protein
MEGWKAWRGGRDGGVEGMEGWKGWRGGRDGGVVFLGVNWYAFIQWTSRYRPTQRELKKKFFLY